MSRVGQTLLARLHSVFDPQTEPVLALRIRHADGARWRIADESLTLWAGDGEPVAYDLSAPTVGALANAAAADGFEIAYLNSDTDRLSALALLDGEGDQDDSNGDHLSIRTALLPVLLESTGHWYGIAQADIERALAQLILPDSTAEWAELFGSLFGVPRGAGESDPDYTARQMAEVLRTRNAPAGILRNLRRTLGLDIEVREPWREVFVLGRSTLSQRYHLQGPIYQYHTMQLTARTGADWTAVLAQANADRPAGTLMLSPGTHPAPNLIYGVGGAAAPETTRSDVRCSVVYVNTYGWDGGWDARTWVADPVAFAIGPPAVTAS